MTKGVFDAEVDLARVVGFIDRLTVVGGLILRVRLDKTRV